MRSRSTIAMVVLALWLWASTAAAQAPAPTVPLSPERYTAIVTVLKAEVTLDARKPRPMRVRKADRACRALPRTDVLVTAFRAVCRADTDAVATLTKVNACNDIRPCVTSIRRYAAALAAHVSAAREMNRALRPTVPDPPCRNALRYRAAEVRVLVRLHAAVADIERATRSEVPGQMTRALDRFFRVDRRALQGHRARLHAFRVACR
jgi:hypothetical protein